MKRRFLSTLMALVLALSLIPTAALAVEDTIPETENELDTLSDESGAETSAEFEAEVNGVPYATLQEAVAEAQGGDTVTLINDVTLNPRIGDDQEDADSLVCLMTVDQDITLDLNGYTIKWDTSLLEHEEEMPYSPCFFAVVSGGALTLVGNGTIDAEAEGTTSYCINVNGGTATIEDGNYFGAMTVAQVQTGILTVLGGTFALAKTVEVWAPDMAKYIINCIDRNYENGTAVISVRGGTFIGADPADSPEGEGTSYVADGYVSVQDGNQYTVMPLEDAAVAQIGNDYYLTLAEAISNAQDGDTIILVDDTVEDIVASVSIGEVTAKNIVEVEISVNVTATSAELSSENATVTYQVRPIATVKVDGETKSSNITVPNSYLNGQEFTVRLPLPAGLEEPREVMHIADNGSRERFTGDALTIGSGWVEVSISHFSELVVNAQETVAAKIGNAEYGTLQEAVNAAKSGDTIVLQADCNEPITISSKSVTIDRNGHDYNAALVTVGSRCEKTESGGRIIVAYTAPSTSSSSGSSSTTYSPTLDVSDGGTIKVSPRTPEAGDKVTITPDPDSGYEVGEVTVTDRSGDAVRVTANRDGTYTFTQPRGRVTIEVTFVRAGESVFFDDVPASFWAYDEIAWAYDNGYVNGTSATTFSPNSSITRQQVWMILARLSGADPASMAAAREWAMVNDISDGTNPGNAVTRQQLVALLYRYAQLMGYDNGAREALTDFPDAGTVSGYAQEPMQWSVANGIVAGTSAGTLNPAGTATRAQFAVILYRFWDQVG